MTGPIHVAAAKLSCRIRLACKIIQVQTLSALDFAQICPPPCHFSCVKVISATYGYNTKTSERKAGEVGHDRLVAKADNVELLLEPKEDV